MILYNRVNKSMITYNGVNKTIIQYYKVKKTLSYMFIKVEIVFRLNKIQAKRGKQTKSVDNAYNMYIQYNWMNKKLFFLSKFCK